RPRIVARAALHHEMHHLFGAGIGTLQRNAVMLVAVQPRFPLPPVEFVAPPADEAPHIGAVAAVFPGGALGLDRPAHAGQPRLEVGERRFRNADGEFGGGSSEAHAPASLSCAALASPQPSSPSTASAA